MAFHQAVTIQAPLALSTSACSMHVCGVTTGGGGEQQHQSQQQQQLCVAKSYLKYRLEPVELQQVRLARAVRSRAASVSGGLR
jgi:hypothetical protein